MKKLLLSVMAGAALLAGVYVIKRHFTLGAVATVKSAPALQSLPGSPETTQKYKYLSSPLVLGVAYLYSIIAL